MMSGDKNLTLHDLVRSHVLPILLQCLKNEDHSSLQFIVASAITNFVSGTSVQGNQTICVGAVPLFVRLLASSALQEYKKVVWELGDFICDSPALHDYFVEEGFVGQSVPLIKPDASILFLRNLAYVISRLCRELPGPSNNSMFAVVQALDELLNFTDVYVLIRTFESVNNLKSEPAKGGFMPKLIPLLGHSEYLVKKAALLAIGGVIETSYEGAQYIRDALPHFSELISHWNQEVRIEAFDFLINVMKKEEVRSEIDVIISSGLVPKIIENLTNTETQVAAIWSIVLVVGGSTRHHVPILIKEGVMPPFCKVLDSPNPPLLWRVLKALNHLLRAADADAPRVANLINECDGLEKMKELRNHEYRKISKLAHKIITKYFPAET